MLKLWSQKVIGESQQKIEIDGSMFIQKYCHEWPKLKKKKEEEEDNLLYIIDNLDYDLLRIMKVVTEDVFHNLYKLIRAG